MNQPIPQTEILPWIELHEEDVFETTTFLFYGTTGSGKTYLSGQFPNPLILACDPGQYGGSMSAKKFNPKVIRITSYDQLLSLLPTLERYIKKEIDTIVIDSVSYLQRIVMNNILIKTGRETPRFDEWNLLVERMRNLINKFADFKCFTVLTATEQIQKDEITGRLIGSPNLPGKLAQELPQACDVVCRLFVTSSLTPSGKQIKYRFQSTPDDIWISRDRTGTLPPEGDTKIEMFQHLLKLNKGGK